MKNSRYGVSKKCPKLCHKTVVESCRDEGKVEEEEEEEEEGQKMKNELMNAIPAGEPGERELLGKLRLLPKALRQGDRFRKSELGVGQKDWLEGAASGLK